MGARLAVIAAALAAIVVPAAQAAAAPAPYGQAASPVVADAERFAVYTPEAGTLTIRDDRKRTSRNIPVDPACTPRAGSHGRFLLGCTNPASPNEERPVILTASTGSLSTLLDTGFSGWVSYWRIGRHWLEGVDAGSGHQVLVYVNWRTGEERSYGEVIGEGTSPRPDLDDPRLRLTGPRRGTGELYLVHGRYRLREYERRPRVVVRWRNRRMTRRCRTACDSITLGSRLATLAEGRRVWALDLRTRRTTRWTFTAPLAGNLGVQHTSRYVYFSTAPGGTEPLQLYRQRRP